MFSGVLEFNGGECPPPTVINLLGIVPKNSETLPFRLVSDARKGNLSLEKWPVRLSKGWAPESLGVNRWKWARKGPLRGLSPHQQNPESTGCFVTI